MLGVEVLVLVLGDVAGERHKLRAELVAEVGRCAATAIGEPSTAPGRVEVASEGQLGIEIRRLR